METIAAALLSGFRCLAGVIILALVGWPLRLATQDVPSRLVRWVLSACVGCVVVTWLMVATSLVALKWNLALLMAAGLAVSFVASSFARSTHERPAEPLGAQPAARLRLSWGDALAFTAILAAIACTLLGKASSPDLLYFWGPKAERFWTVGGVDAAFLKRPFLDYMHASYPPLLPNLYAWFAMVAGGFSWRAATLAFPLLLGVLWICERALLGQVGPRTERPLLAALMVGCIGLIGIQSLFGGIAEMPLVLFEAVGITLLSAAKVNARSQLVAGIFLAGAVATKTEGIAVVGPAAIAFALLQPRSSRLGSATRVALPSAVYFTTWFAFGRMTGLFRSFEYSSLTQLNWTYLGAIGRALVAALGHVAWGLPYWLPFLGLICVRPRPAMLVPISGMVGLVMFLSLVYLNASGEPSQWISWSATRVLSPIPAMAVILLAIGRRIDSGESAGC